MGDDKKGSSYVAIICLKVWQKVIFFLMELRQNSQFSFTFTIFQKSPRAEWEGGYSLKNHKCRAGNSSGIAERGEKTPAGIQA